MKYKQYSPDIWHKIEQAVDDVLKVDSNPVAAFDADGTLWDIDLGETFFNYQIENKLVPLPKDPFQHYEEMKKINNDPRSAYLWLAQINKGQNIDAVRNWAQKAVDEQAPLPIFEEQQKLISLLKRKGVEIYVVTASIKWAVEPGALSFYGIPNQNVIGIQTKVLDKNITDLPEGIITYRQGKVDALLNATNGKKPFLCSGNTMGDFELLTSATHIALAVSAASQDDKIYRTERELQNQASLKGWLGHRFI